MDNKRYNGRLGFAITMETDPENHPSVWESVIVEKSAKGDILMNNIQYNASSQVNDEITISNQISVVASPYVLKNWEHIVYATYMRQKWRVSNVKLAFPRIILTLGGVYSEQQD